MVSVAFEDTNPGDSFSPSPPAVTTPSSPKSCPLSLPPYPQGPVPAVWTGAHGTGSPALCAGSPGSSNLPSEPRTGSSTLHTSAQPEPGTAEGDKGEGSSLGFPGVVQLAPRAALVCPAPSTRQVPEPVCSAVAALRSFSPPALSAVIPWLSARSCFSGLPSPLVPFSSPKGNNSVNLMQFNKYTLSFCVPKPELGYRNEKNLVLAHRAEIPVIWWNFSSRLEVGSEVSQVM